MVYNIDGTLLPGFPKTGNIYGVGNPAISDIDLDGRNEIIIRVSDLTLDPIIFVYDLGVKTRGTIEWGQYGKNSSHNSFYPKSDRGTIAPILYLLLGQ